jgi:membrane protein required for beta-lactamase induction
MAIVWEKVRSFMTGMMFWLLIGLVTGSVLTGYGLTCYQKYRVQEAISLGCFLHDSKIYEIKMR